MSKSRELADIINNLKNFQKKTDDEFFEEVKEKQKRFRVKRVYEIQNGICLKIEVNFKK